MRSFWLFRSNIKFLEYYHQYKSLKAFEKNCHDYYMLLPLWLLKNDYFDQVIVWRLTKNPRPDIKFEINGKFYIQRWVRNFEETLQFGIPDISFWRGGFQEYDMVTRKHPKHFGKKLYLGAGRRITSQWGGLYNAYLMEDERDFIIGGKTCIPFYKTASPHIFHPIENSKIEYDICWPANFTQLRHKGQEAFIKLIGSNSDLKYLRIVNCGNMPRIGKKLCKKYNVKNIEFVGWVDRTSLNELLNKSKCGLNYSNLQDGCPRVSTEILMSGTPLILRDSVRLLKEYRVHGVINTYDNIAAVRLIEGTTNYKFYKKHLMNVINGDLSFDNVNKKNIDIWKTL